MFTERHYDAPPVDPGVTDELWVYLATDPGGTTGVAYYETSGGARVPLVAPSEGRAIQLAPLAQALADLTGRSLTLTAFGSRRDVNVVTPSERTST
ncbi:MAG: hypothetical protein KGH75_00235 [Rhodospirillales bacterium]|nr:hypothetical protein [Rhodospirillales bacterium]